MSKLPQELIDQIIDDLKGNVKSLSACSLTSSRWLPRSRLHIHSALSIGLSPSKNHFHNHIAFFLQFPEASTYVVDLRIRTSTDGLGVWPLTFPNVKSLFLADINWHRVSYAAQDFVATQLSAVTRLRLFDVEFETFREFASFLRGFPKLATLKLNRISLKQYLVAPEDYGQYELNLDLLEADSSDLSHHGLVQWLQRQNTPPSVKRLRLQGGSTIGSALKNLRDWCSIAGGSLQHLIFDVGWVQLNRGYNEQLASLAQNTHIQTIEMKRIVINSSIYRWLPIMLMHINSDALKRITLHLHFDDNSHLTQEGLACIDNALDGYHFGEDESSCRKDSIRHDSLKSVEIVLWHNVITNRESPRLLRWVEEKMPRMATRGVLKVMSMFEYNAAFQIDG